MSPATAHGPPPTSEHAQRYAHYLPRDIDYNASFEDSIERTILSPPAAFRAGVRILPSLLPAPPGLTSSTVQADSISPSTLPKIALADLPLALDHSARTYACPVLGIKLTHPGGYIQGGPGFNPSEDEFARHFISDHRIRDEEMLTRLVNDEVERNVKALHARMRARRKAREENERIEREIKALQDQMELETRVLSKAREKARERRERKERKVAR